MSILRFRLFDIDNMALFIGSASPGKAGFFWPRCQGSLHTPFEERCEFVEIGIAVFPVLNAMVNKD